MFTAAKIIGFIISALPTLLKIAEFVKMAATALKDKPGPEKMAWVMEQLKEKLPNLSGDKLYDMVNLVLNLLRSMGAKV